MEYPRYYVLVDSGRPVRKRSLEQLQEVLDADGLWQPFPDTDQFLHRTEVVSREEFRVAVREWLRSVGSTKQGASEKSLLKVKDRTGHEHDNQGRFTSGGGGGGTSKPDSGGKPSASAGLPGGAKFHAAAQGKARKFADLVKELPAAAYGKAKAKVVEHYRRFEARYGRKTAIAIVAAGVLGTAIPLPGTTLLAAAPVVGMAELYLRFMGGAGAAPAKAANLSLQEIRKLGRKFVKDLLAEWERESVSQR